MKFDKADLGRIHVSNASLTVTNSTFTNVTSTNDDKAEHITGAGNLPGGVFLIDGNTFGTVNGHNDAIDFDSSLAVGTPVVQILNNTFNGGRDDGLDLTNVTALIENNTFANFVKDASNTDTGPASTISAVGGTYTVVRNRFLNSNHVANVRNGAS